LIFNCLRKSAGKSRCNSCIFENWSVHLVRTRASNFPNAKTEHWSC
jgi:hypothetical protein